jgi:hypothetical protein
VVVDGRNRRDACEIAGVAPTFKRLDPDTDLKAFILSVNLNWRHMTAAQRAMAHALIYPKPEVGGKREAGISKIPDGFSKQRLSLARSVLAFSRPIALAGGGDECRPWCS